jgi:hypothetical protein
MYDSRGRGKPLEDYIEVVVGDENEQSINNNVEDTIPKTVISDNSNNYTENVIVDPVLSYVIFAMDNSRAGYVTNCCIQFYTVEELTRAKDIIWDVADTDIVGPYIRRRDGPKRSAVDNVAADITGAIQKLDLAGMVPKVAVDPSGLNRIPKVIPAETNALSMCERLVVMESRIKQLEESMSDNVCKTISISEKVNNMTSYANAVTGQVVSSASPNPHLQVSPSIASINQQQRIQTQIGNQQITSV